MVRQYGATGMVWGFPDDGANVHILFKQKRRNTIDQQHPIDRLVPDIYGLFRTGHAVDPKLAEEFGTSLATVVASRLGEAGTPRVATLRMSNLGKPDRQLWYQFHPSDEHEAEVLEPHTHLKFLIGDIYESVLLFLAKCAGHEVSSEQGEVEVDGIKGHIDAVIDDHVVDVKSASSFAFKKFKYGTLSDDDPFGYIDQIGGYSTALKMPGAFLAGDKQNGHIALLKVPQADTEGLRISERIAYLKEMVVQDEEPARCYEPVPDGLSGNMALAVGCSYCPHKFRCWADANDGIGVRTFLYSSGPKHLVNVAREPKCPELTL